MTRRLLALICLLMVSACGGGDGGGTSAPGSGNTGNAGGGSTAPALTNYAPVVVDAGPPALSEGADGYTATNIPYVTVTICAPGTTNCQTIDHVILDTGSVGLRLEAGVLNPALLGALPGEASAAGNPVGECYAYIDGYAFGSVRQADFQIGGEQVAAMPLQVVGDTGTFASVPGSCSSGGGVALDSVQTLGGNGIIGIGTSPTDCGSYCTTAAGSGAATYYDCPASGCSAIIARQSSTSAPFQQLPNPVAAFATDNNGTILSLPSISSAGVISASGMLYFGIGTQTNNGLGTATVITTNSAGDFTTIYNNNNLNQSYIDSGSNLYYFVDPSIPLCRDGGYQGDYCPTSPDTITTTMKGANGATTAYNFILYNVETEPASSSNAIPGIGANSSDVGFASGFTRSFDFGLPFFYGKKVYTAISGRSAGGIVGPYYAF